MDKIFFLLTLLHFTNGQVGNRCTVRLTGKGGVCKISTDCPKVEEQAQKGINPTFCGFQQLPYVIVCCENDDLPQPNENLFTGDGDTDLSDSFIYPSDDDQPPSLRISEQKCQEYHRDVTGAVGAIALTPDSEPQIINYVKCDYNGVALIVGGKPASAGEFPFMAALGFEIDGKIDWRCGGTLISDEYVLTAAHCTLSRDADKPKVIRLGDLDLSTDIDGSVHVDYPIGQIIAHPKYVYPQRYNDIALIRTRGRVRFTKFIRPACLYHKTAIEQDHAIATGWGKTDYAAADTNSKLMKVTLNVYNNNQCARIYTRDKYLPRGIIPSMLCAGELKGGMDTCQGDSGGPLLVTNKGNHCKFYVIGVTSFGKSCGQANIPAVYTRVSEYIPWIENIVWLNKGL